MPTHPLIRASRDLCQQIEPLPFSSPVTQVYNPLVYAQSIHEAYLKRFGSGRKRVVWLGMNPGPWGMAQTGVPFGEVAAVRDWMGLDGRVDRPESEHPARPIEGLACTRSEVSGRRLWGLIAERFGPPERFFESQFVANYCPLVFMAQTGRNITPDKLPAGESKALFKACDDHLRRIIDRLEPEILLAVGGWAEKRLNRLLTGSNPPRVLPRVCRVLHPSPASPLANRGWAEQASMQLVEQGVWPDASA